MNQAKAIQFIEEFEIVGENNSSRNATDEEKFVLREFVLQLFDACARGDLADPKQGADTLYTMRPNEPS